jgi:hypothetical protein
MFNFENNDGLKETFGEPFIGIIQMADNQVELAK